jgi:hypothetical protein
MSTKRDLDHARAGVVNAALAWADEAEIVYNELSEREQALYRRVQDILPLLVDLDGDAPANATYTSIAAAKSLPAGGLRRGVLRAVYWATRSMLMPGITTDALEVRLGRMHTSVSSAVNYLVNHGLLEKAGVRQKTRQGRLAEAYRLTSLGERLLAEEVANGREVR